MTFVSSQYGGVSGASERALYAAVGGIYAPVPYFDDTSPAYLVVDMTDWPGGLYFRLSAINDDILYCFVKESTDVMELGYQYDPMFGVPDIIGIGTSVRELHPTDFPYLLLKSTALASADTNPEIRLRRA